MPVITTHEVSLNQRPSKRQAGMLTEKGNYQSDILRACNRLFCNHEERDGKPNRHMFI